MSIKKFIFINSDSYKEESIVEGVVKIKTCDSGVAVGDLVVESVSSSDTVEKVTNNNDTRSVCGIVLSKSDTTKADVLYQGIIDVLGLTKGERIYLSTTGTLTHTKPTTNYIQILGWASDVNKMYFNPVQNKIKAG